MNFLFSENEDAEVVAFSGYTPKFLLGTISGGIVTTLLCRLGPGRGNGRGTNDGAKDAKTVQTPITAITTRTDPFSGVPSAYISTKYVEHIPGESGSIIYFGNKAYKVAYKPAIISAELLERYAEFDREEARFIADLKTLKAADGIVKIIKHPTIRNGPLNDIRSILIDLSIGFSETDVKYTPPPSQQNPEYTYLKSRGII